MLVLSWGCDGVPAAREPAADIGGVLSWGCDGVPAAREPAADIGGVVYDTER